MKTKAEGIPLSKARCGCYATTPDPREDIPTPDELVTVGNLRAITAFGALLDEPDGGRYVVAPRPRLRTRRQRKEWIRMLKRWCGITMAQARALVPRW